jgi:hypothetical protein
MSDTVKHLVTLERTELVTYAIELPADLPDANGIAQTMAEGLAVRSTLPAIKGLRKITHVHTPWVRSGYSSHPVMAVEDE